MSLAALKIQLQLKTKESIDLHRLPGTRSMGARFGMNSLRHLLKKLGQLFKSLLTRHDPETILSPTGLLIICSEVIETV